MKYCKIDHFVSFMAFCFPRQAVGVITSFSSFSSFSSSRSCESSRRRRVPVRHLNKIECVFKSVPRPCENKRPESSQLLF